MKEAEGMWVSKILGSFEAGTSGSSMRTSFSAMTATATIRRPARSTTAAAPKIGKPRRPAMRHLGLDDLRFLRGVHVKLLNANNDFDHDCNGDESASGQRNWAGSRTNREAESSCHRAGCPCRVRPPGQIEPRCDCFAASTLAI